VLVPVKAFRAAKVRLAAALDAEQRAQLARSMGARVVAAAAPLPVAVVCDDEEVRAWAADVGAHTLWHPGKGLNGAVEAGVADLASAGFDQVVVAHADLPLATELAWLASYDGITLVPDRHGDGTNAACVPARARFRFAYGPGSSVRHAAEARRLGLGLRLVHDQSLAWDVDLPADLDYHHLEGAPLDRPA